MKKTIIALMLLIPLILLVSLFSIGKVASLSFDIPASGISITTQTQDGFLDIDLANYNEDIYIKAQVEPKNASNQEYTISTLPVDDSNFANITIDKDGKMTLNSLGKAKIVVESKDKGFKDSIIVNVYSTKIVSMLPTIKDHLENEISLSKDENNSYLATICGGYYDFSTLVYPTSLSDSSISWSSSDNTVVSINPLTGQAKALLSGTSTIKAVSNNGVKGNIETQIKVTVTQSPSNTNLLVNGLNDDVIKIDKKSNTVSFYIEKTNTSSEEIKIENANIDSYSLTPINSSLNKYLATVKFKASKQDEEEIKIRYDSSSQSNSIRVSFLDFSFDVVTSYHMSLDYTINQKLSSTVTFHAMDPFIDKSVTYVWHLIQGNSVKLSTPTSYAFCDVQAINLGKSKIRVDAVKNNETIYSVEKEISVIENVLSIEFTDNKPTYGIEDLLTVPNKEIKNDNYIDYRHPLKLKILTNSGVKEYLQNDLVFTSSNNDIISPFATLTSLKANVQSTGIATINAEWKYNQYFNTNVSAKIKLRGVNEAVNVSDYSSLKKATNDGKSIVLTNSIMLGHKNMSLSELNQNSYKMATTYDWQFHINEGKQRPTVNYLIEFKNDVYGNGYTINADNFTQAKDSAGNSLLFKGPVNFVSIATAAVKAQDNICFLVRKDGILINNINLLGCLDESLYEDDKFNLSNLNNVGTTLEIAASCSVVNSRISNGRTTVRIFGGKTANTSPIVKAANEHIASDGRINVDISSCILTNAREFIVKIGSNRAVMSQGTSEETFKQTKFYNESNVEYDPFNHENWKDEYFYNNFVSTDVTINNSTLATSGIFAIGMETHFSGVMLSGYSSLNPTNWNDLAATSYASVLHLKGDVKILDWKDIEKLDSSTLIETTANSQEFLDFDIQAMLKKVHKEKDYENILSTIDSNQYVHSGIAFYGGGYNYSCLDLDNFTSEHSDLVNYKANLLILSKDLEQDLNNSLYLQGTMLPLAAGEADFEFFIYDKNSTFNYEKQLLAMAEGNEYKVKPTMVS